MNINYFCLTKLIFGIEVNEYMIQSHLTYKNDVCIIC